MNSIEELDYDIMDKKVIMEDEMGPIDNENFDEIRIINTTCKYIEIICLIAAIAEKEKYKYYDSWIKEFRESFSEQSIEALRLISTSKHNGLEMIEFLVNFDDISNVDEILGRIDKYSRGEYLYRLFGEDIEKDDIEGIINRKIDLE